MEPLIRVSNLHFTYNEGSQRAIPALRGIDLTVEQGEYVAIIGANGSGKSTLARHFNALLLPTRGDVWVNRMNTRDRERLGGIRRSVAMVFQHPESQIVATSVEEDVAFGPENLGIPPGELRQRVDWALEAVGLSGMNKRAPHHLSGGQKQRLALAGALAMQPQCIVLDEATAMLDPAGRRALRQIIEQLHDRGVTIVIITQDMEEAAAAERVVVLSGGVIARQGASRQVLTDEGFLHKVGLDLPPMARLAQQLHALCPGFPANLLTSDEVVEAMKQHASSSLIPISPQVDGKSSHYPLLLGEGQEASDDGFIEVRDLHYTYMSGTPMETVALRGVDLTVRQGEIVGVIGATGSGKSTLLQHLNGLLRPQRGVVRVANNDIGSPHTDLRAIRQRVALLFQHPEDQLFERYVADDIAYGPLNLGLPLNEVRERVRRAMEAMGLPLGEFGDRPVFSLSGGERRRAALAGVLALEPQILVLDEATAGLDPRGRHELINLLRHWQHGERSIIWASHSMDEIAQLVSRVYVLSEGRLVLEGDPRQVFQRIDQLSSCGLDVPVVKRVLVELAGAGLPVATDALTLEEAVPILAKYINE